MLAMKAHPRPCPVLLLRTMLLDTWLDHSDARSVSRLGVQATQPRLFDHVRTPDWSHACLLGCLVRPGGRFLFGLGSPSLDRFLRRREQWAL